MRALRGLTVAALAVVSAASLAAIAPTAYAADVTSQDATNATPQEIWTGLSDALFHGQTMTANGGIIQLGTPLSAEDAAIVPVTLHMNTDDPTMKADDPNRVKKVTLVIDQNPSPVVAVFELGPKAEITTIETRVRVDQNTKIHAVAETNNGKLYVSDSFVAAAGGCSAPSASNLAPNDIGQIKVRAVPGRYATDDPNRKEAVVMIKHPNNSGMQMNQTTHLYIPARYIDSLKVMQGDQLLFAMTGGISISEDPNFRFSYLSNGSDMIHVAAADSTGKHFSMNGPLQPAM